MHSVEMYEPFKNQYMYVGVHVCVCVCVHVCVGNNCSTGHEMLCYIDLYHKLRWGKATTGTYFAFVIENTSIV